jgi:hypothetical protein
MAYALAFRLSGVAGTTVDGSLNLGSGREGQPHDNTGAARFRLLDQDLTTMVFQHPLHNGQAKPGPLDLRCIE